MYSSKFDKWNAEAESYFTNGYGGAAADFIGANSYAGGEFIGGDTYQADGLDTIDEADRTLTIKITNTLAAAGTTNAILFSAYKNATLTQTTGITVSVLESTHEQLRKESEANPFFIKGIKYIVSDEDQFSNNIVLESGTASGATTTKSFQPLAYRSAQNQINTQIDAPNFAFMVDGRATWTVPVKNGTNLTFIFQIKTRGNQGNILKGRGVTSIARGQAPSGLPQLDR